jgi:hypothetical protein
VAKPQDATNGKIVGALAMRDACPFILDMHKQKTEMPDLPDRRTSNILMDFIASHSITGKLREMAVKRKFVVVHIPSSPPSPP